MQVLGFAESGAEGIHKILVHTFGACAEGVCRIACTMRPDHHQAEYGTGGWVLGLWDAHLWAAFLSCGKDPGDTVVGLMILFRLHGISL